MTEHVALNLRYMNGATRATDGRMRIAPIDGQGRVIPRIYDHAAHALLAGSVYAEADDESGEVRAQLPATDDPSLDPSGFVWRAVLTQRGSSGARTVTTATFALPSGSTSLTAPLWLDGYVNEEAPA